MAQLSLYTGYKAPFHTPRSVLVALVFSLLNALTYNTFRLLSSGEAAGGWGINFCTAIIPNLNKPEEGPEFRDWNFYYDFPKRGKKINQSYMSIQWI